MTDSTFDKSRILRCAKCGATVPGFGPGQTVGRTATCDACSADLHACLQCAHYDESAYNGCKETQAERVVDKERSNFCDYFSLAGGPSSKDETERQNALKKLDDLFK
ncbi:MAG: hypothetical protein ACO3XO_04170 [Bdellovibrionota bacterium]|jgi:hypothetical protein